MGLRSCCISHLLIEESTGNQLVFLRECDGDRRFSIGIGPLEALAIQRVLQGETFPRPLTHDLLATVLATFDLELEEVRIVRLANETFYAEIDLVGDDGRRKTLDCRPSDALALLVRGDDIPLLVSEDILDAIA